jgi:uncharacterized protein (DUF2342 family)
VTDLIAKRVLDDYEGLNRQMEQRRQRPPVMRLIEAMAGIEMKRQQYVQGRDFCRAVWDAGGSAALAPAWTGPDRMPTQEELKSPKLWLERVA